MNAKTTRSTGFLRYPGGKGRFITSLAAYLPPSERITRTYVEPFIGGGAVFFFVSPPRAVLSDINAELIDLYRGIQETPEKVWEIYRNYPSTKEGYYQIRDQKPEILDTAERAARLLFLNRTCFKGMWRHNANGEFTVGYGGQARRWVVSQASLAEIALKLRDAKLCANDFEEIIDNTESGDFLFLDPPYKPKERELREAHYSYGRFTFADQERLCAALHRAAARGVKWAMTNSSHPDILCLYDAFTVLSLTRGTGEGIGQISKASGEVLILNYLEH